MKDQSRAPFTSRAEENGGQKTRIDELSGETVSTDSYPDMTSALILMEVNYNKALTYLPTYLPTLKSIRQVKELK